MIVAAALLDICGVGIVHHFGDDGSGVYVKETRIPAGARLAMHAHTFTHKSVLASGQVALVVNGKTSEVQAPAVLLMRAGDAHAVHALTDAVWLCIHATEENDPELIDHTLVGA